MVEWSNTRLIREGAVQEIRKMKMVQGKDLAIFGSANLLSTIMDEVDEHRVMVNPVLLGSGNPLFKNTDQKTLLKLVNARTFNSGNVLLSYQPLEDAS